MSRSEALTAAKVARRDEFYTQMADIEAELRHHEAYFRGKSVYCNCDDPDESAFWVFFVRVFRAWGLRRLVATHYAPGRRSSAYILDAVDDSPAGMAFRRVSLDGDGDFRSPECVEILESADVVVTNPPFSLFREFVAQLVEHDRKFLIIGNVNAVTYKDVFPLFRDDRVRFGPSIRSGDREFRVPDDYPLDAAGCRVGGDGSRYIRVKGVRWFTNLDADGRPVPLDLSGRSYRGHEDSYPRYDEYDAINVGRVADIPGDYDGVMGVPITFLDKHCPEQFEIVGIDRYVEDNPYPGRRFRIDGREVYARVLIRRK